MSWDRPVSVAMGYGLDGEGLIPGKDEIFLSPTTSRPAMGHTNQTIQWVPGAFSLRAKQLGQEADYSSHLVLRSRMVELYLHFPTCLHGVVLNYLSTGRT
jgi:hypothetical protein